MHCADRGRSQRYLRQVRFLKRVLLTGADLTIANMHGDTALHLGARLGNPAIVQSLLEHGAPLNARTPELRTPLMAAMLGFHLGDRVNMQRTTEMLIAANADLNAVGHTGQTALFIAVCQAAFSPSNVTYFVPASVCIALIEAGQNCHLYQMYFIEKACC